MTLINDQSVSSENSEKTSGFYSSLCPDLSIVTGSSNQDQTLTNELSYFDEFKLLDSTAITIDNKTFNEKLETTLARKSIISNIDSDDDKSDTEIINQDNPVIVNNEEMAVVIPNIQQVSLRDTLEVVPLFEGSNIPLSHFIEVCMEAKAMLPTPAAQENSIFGSTYATRGIDRILKSICPCKKRVPVTGRIR